MKFLQSLFLLLLSVYLSAQKNGGIITPTLHPSFQVDFNSPTADKPQSKLWYMFGSWWALLPKSTGPSLWQRTNDGWKEDIEITKVLKGIPGRADVWPELQSIAVVCVGKRSLMVFQLITDHNEGKTHWKLSHLNELTPPSCDKAIETATIVKDETGKYWVNAVVDKKVYVWNSSSSFRNWTSPFMLADGLDSDDISVISNTRGGVCVIWSDQIKDAVISKEHKNGDPADIWSEEIIVQSGNKTADDHLNTSLSSDGTLWLVTKNSLDTRGKPQFDLRIRKPDGIWTNKPYLILEKNKFITRPIVVATQNSSIVLTGHHDSDRSIPFPYDSKIVFSTIDTLNTTIFVNPQTVICPDISHKSLVNNVTGPRHPFPTDAPWIILASDNEGRVYEADLKKFFGDKGSTNNIK